MARSKPSNRQGRRLAGVSLAEVIVCTMLVSVMIVGAIRTVTATRLTRRTAVGATLAPGLAQELLGEVLAQAYADPETPAAAIGTDSDEPSRASYDDVDDYNGYSADAETRLGEPIPGYDGWTLSVEVAWVEDDMTVSGSDTGLKRVVVKAANTNDAREVATLTALRGSAGQFEKPPQTNTEAVVWVGAALRAGGAEAAARTGVQLPNLTAKPN